MHHKPRHTENEIAIDRHDAGTRPHGWLLPVLLVAQLMVILDITAVNIALPHIATDLQLSGSNISWTITSYSLIFGSLLLFGGRAADLLGRRRMFLSGLGVFTVSSFFSAMAGSAATLFAARAGQGLGAAILSPAALSIITAAFQGAHRAKALAAWGAIGGAGAAIGVLVGGVLTEFADWRTIFYVNLPVAALLLFASLKIVPADAHKPRPRGLDLPGAALATTSLVAIVYGITQAESAGWTSLQTHLCGLGGLAGLVAFAIYELHIDAPLLRVERIADRAVGGGLMLMLAAAGSIFGLFLLCSLYLQNVLGMGPLATGLAFIPLALSAGIGAHVAGHVVAKHGVRGRSPERSQRRRWGWSCCPASAKAAATSATCSPACWSPALVSASQWCPSRWQSSRGRARKRPG
jgi:EmrB/QacA subfamily drug resistance transporter